MLPRILLGGLAVMFWTASVWLFANRRRLDHINTVLPLLRRHRRGGLHPLFRRRSDVLALSGLFFALGLGLVVILAVL